MPEVERVQSLTEQLRREVGIERTRISVSATQLKEYCVSEPDPLLEGIPKRDNPFIKKSSCIIL